ncbi:indole-3-glycerol phosphate synthase TrpC [Parvularcula sp. IMCC14364]|uniref:indole-3-glycerol phosphate synthase TrpC n=1 Tax=Parvularcula sp. IMCC14364 TaxID=3067902 RepID=UPI002740F390|nr:indole-3-glycerol phosphate synthase TrpC [Parvularcula sp. IMCC14364]
MTILDDIVAYKKLEVAASKRDKPLSVLEQEIASAEPVRPFLERLRNASHDGYGLIAEIKKASPSKALIRADFDPPDLARAYQAGGATCLSVLTDTPSFQGKPEFLQQARDAVSLPVLRKDFMIDPYQMAQARSWGADCILLIVACLSDQQLAELEEAALHYDMDVLIETHDKQELERALQCRSELIGVNNRNLRTFETSLQTSERLATLCPSDRLLVSESGLSSRDDLDRMARTGIRTFLIGESLMRQHDVKEATCKLLA